ncbi:DNA metabolism protein [Lithospermum erythrorhizon]|uniref:PHD finger protein ALFIN-LIKE n=1 Tax=Lithospermum erythrorhizon TaxID=34254 RepID=A0AAV3QUM5_LITER
MINDLPTVFEVVSGTIKQPKQENSAHNSSKHKSGRKAPRQFESQGKPAKMSAPKEEDESVKEEEDEDEQGGTLCGACGDNYGTDEFWICCDLCERWFHGKCVKITPAKAEHIKRYKCPGCSNKRGRV